jgi:hypothetical protein
MKREGKDAEACSRSGIHAQKSAAFAVVWEHQSTHDAEARIEKAFEMLLGSALDALSNCHPAEYHEKTHSGKDAAPNQQVGGNT